MPKNSALAPTCGTPVRSETHVNESARAKSAEQPYLFHGEIARSVRIFVSAQKQITARSTHETSPSRATLVPDVQVSRAIDGQTCSFVVCPSTRAPRVSRRAREARMRERRDLELEQNAPFRIRHEDLRSVDVPGASKPSLHARTRRAGRDGARERRLVE